MLKRLIILFFLLLISLTFGEVITPSSEVNIDIKAEKGYGNIRISWEMNGIPEFDKLELKIINRIETDEVIDITDKTAYVLDRGFPLDEEGNFKDISFFIVSTIPVKKRIGVKYYKTGINYLTSVTITTAPLNFPSPKDVWYGSGELTCKLHLDIPELIDRFYGFKVDGKEYKSIYNVSGLYNIQVGMQDQPLKISALFESIDKPIFKQSSKMAQISVSKEVIDIADAKPEIVQKTDSNDDKITTKPEIVQEPYSIDDEVIYSTSESLVTNEEDIIPSDEVFIDLVAQEGYGYIKINWEVQGIQDYDILELKILDRIEQGEEVIDITDRTGYILDRGFLKDDEGNYKEISFWVVATIDIKKKIGVKYHKTGTDYLASVMITTAPLNFPAPINPNYNNGYISCQLTLDNPNLIERFYGFKVDNKEYKKSYDFYGNYQIQVRNHPSKITALFTSFEKPILKQESKRVEISKTSKKIAVLKYSTNDDKISYIASDSDSIDSENIFGLYVEKVQASNCISISWNKIDTADYYFIYRTPAQDSLYKSFKANSLLEYESARYDRVRFDNNYQSYNTFQKEKLKSKNVYNYWVKAKNMFEDLGTSDKISIYYYQGSNRAFSQELQVDSIEMESAEQYQEISSKHKGISNALETKGFAKHVIDFQAESDSLSFSCYYIDLKPYRYLESGNDGYINIEDVVRAFLPLEYGNDMDLLALMLIINYNPSVKKQNIQNSKIMTDDIIKIPIPVELTEPAK